MLNILITGANGFIGSFLVEEAIRRNWQTWAGIRQSSSLVYLQDPRIHFIDLDYAHKDQLKKQILAHAARYGSWDYVIHNAGVTKCLDSSDFNHINYFFTKQLIEALQETGQTPKKFVLMSSLSAHCCEGDTAYGRSKLKAEHFLRSQSNFPFIILCPTGVYGPREKDYYLLLKTIQKGLDITVGFEPQKLSFIYVKDLVKAVYLSLDRPVENRTYLVSDGQVYSDREYTEIAKNALGKKRVLSMRIPLFALKIISIVAEDFSRFRGQVSTLNRDKYRIMAQRDWSCDTRPLHAELGFEADYDLQHGIEESVRWYRENSWL
ncbi:MAG: NAD(P)-dependent oxidoreductase [Candidatus Azobacteroides sp.]|nr:NAD(P)-dependent oxidoreductase [Candidatus Azobacteroides sp.]